MYLLPTKDVELSLNCTMLEILINKNLYIYFNGTHESNRENKHYTLSELLYAWSVIDPHESVKENKHYTFSELLYKLNGPHESVKDNKHYTYISYYTRNVNGPHERKVTLLTMRVVAVYVPMPMQVSGTVHSGWCRTFRWMWCWILLYKMATREKMVMVLLTLSYIHQKDWII